MKQPKFIAIVVLSLFAASNFVINQSIIDLRSTNKTLELAQKGINNGVIEQEYSWIGDHWIPNNGVPSYNAEEMKETLKHHNILWVGDSTCRQDFATMFGTINNTVEYQNNIPTSPLNENINVNKHRLTKVCRDRDFSNSSARGKSWTPETFLCWKVPGANKGYGKFDMGGMACPHFDSELKSSILGVAQEYDVLLFVGGIWEIERNWDCRRDNTTTKDRLWKTLDGLKKVASSDLTIFWKTIGPSSHATNNANKMNLTETYNMDTRQWFKEEEPRNMFLLDWGKQILPRSLGSDRISGDLAPHWGLEARTLNAQMLTHALKTLFV